MKDPERYIVELEKHPEMKEKLIDLFLKNHLEEIENVLDNVQSPSVQAEDIDKGNSLPDVNFPASTSEYEGGISETPDDLMSNAEKAVFDNSFGTENQKPAEETKPTEVKKTEEPKFSETVKPDASEKSIKELTTAIEDLQLQVKELLSKEAVRQEKVEKFVETVNAKCEKLDHLTDRFINLNEHFIDGTTKQLDVYFNNNWDKLDSLKSQTESMIKKIFEIGVKNLNASVAEQRNFIKSISLKFNFASMALIFTGFFTPLFLLYLIAILKRWI